MSIANPCKGKTKGGQPCKGFAVAGSDFCFAHDPASAAKRAESRSQGGKARYGNIKANTENPEPAPHRAVKLGSMKDAIKLLEYAVNDVLRLENSVSRAKVVVSVASAYGRLFEALELSERIEALEARLNERENENPTPRG
jgi:hypothetical protein